MVVQDLLLSGSGEAPVIQLDNEVSYSNNKFFGMGYHVVAVLLRESCSSSLLV